MRSGRRGPEVPPTWAGRWTGPSWSFNEVRAKRPGSTPPCCRRSRRGPWLASMRSGRRGPEVPAAAPLLTISADLASMRSGRRGPEVRRMTDETPNPVFGASMRSGRRGPEVPFKRLTWVKLPLSESASMRSGRRGPEVHELRRRHAHSENSEASMRSGRRGPEVPSITGGGSRDHGASMRSGRRGPEVPSTGVFAIRATWSRLQ